MAISAKTKSDLKALKALPKLAQKEFAVRLKPLIGDPINKLIESGISPVKGGGRFKKYSDSYKKAIKKKTVRDGKGNLHPEKRARPVNLTVTRKLLESQKIKVKGNGIVVSYKRKTSFLGYDLAKLINAGTDKMPARRILPNKEGEKFSKKINDIIKGLARAVLAKHTRKKK